MPSVKKASRPKIPVTPLEGLITPVKMGEDPLSESAQDEVLKPTSAASQPEMADVSDSVLNALVESAIMEAMKKRSVEGSTAAPKVLLETPPNSVGTATQKSTSLPKASAEPVVSTSSLQERIAGLVAAALEKQEAEYVRVTGDKNPTGLKADGPVAESEIAPVFRLREAPDPPDGQAAESARTGSGRTGKRKRRASTSDSDASSEKSEGLVRGSEALTGLRVLDPKEWASLDEVGRAAMALNIESYYGVIASGGNPGLEKELAAHSRILQLVLRNMGTLRTTAEFLRFCVDVAELTVGRLQVMRKGVTSSWTAADAYEKALFNPRSTPSFLKKGEQAAERVERKEKKTRKPTTSTTSVEENGGGRGRWTASQKRAHREKGGKY